MSENCVRTLFCAINEMIILIINWYYLLRFAKVSYLIKSLDLNDNQIIKIDNPIISRKIKILSNEKVDNQDLYIFEKKVFCSIGRLTRQKNYLELIKGFTNFSKKKWRRFKFNYFRWRRRWTKIKKIYKWTKY